MNDRDPEAFRALYSAHYGTVCRYLSVRTDRDLVEDVAAETFLVAWRRERELPEHVVPWLLNTASKCLANQRRSEARFAALAERLAGSLSAGAGGIEDDLARGEPARALLAALATLSEPDRELLLLRHWDGLAPRDVASALQLSPVLVRKRLSRAGRRLQEALTVTLDHAEPGLHTVELSEI